MPIKFYRIDRWIKKVEIFKVPNVLQIGIFLLLETYDPVIVKKKDYSSFQPWANIKWANAKNKSCFIIIQSFGKLKEPNALNEILKINQSLGSLPEH